MRGIYAIAICLLCGKKGAKKLTLKRDTFFSILGLGLAMGLKCWKTPSGRVSNRRDSTTIVAEDTCSSSDKSCMGIYYHVGREQCKMSHFKKISK